MYPHEASPELKIIAQLVHIVDRLTERPFKPTFAITTSLNNQTIIMANINLSLGTPKTGIFTLLDASLNPIPGVTFSNQSVGANSNPGFATFALDGGNPNNVIGTPIANGSGTIVFTADASYNDPQTGQSVSASFSITKNYTVGGPGGVTLDVVFS
jgi:hypothetical protein